MTTFSHTANLEEDFYKVVDRLKTQDALPSHCFLKELPFFNVPSIPKETQLRELYSNSCDTELCNQLLKNILPAAAGAETTIVPRNFSSIPVMSMSQIILYKVLPCPHANCSCAPREIATHNQYKDFEYECPFYHHERDMRRLAITENEVDEFVYKANYFEEGKRPYKKENYSQNYFESMFHPLYYKMFHCKREFCNRSAFCPFFHSEQERNTWAQIFQDFIKKDRMSFLKEKQKKADKKPKEQENRKSGNQEEKHMNYRTLSRKPHSYLAPQGHKNQNLFDYRNELIGNQKNDFKVKKIFFENKVLTGLKFVSSSYRKDSDSSSSEEEHEHGFFSKLQERVHLGIY